MERKFPLVSSQARGWRQQLNDNVASSMEASHSGWHATPGIHTAWEQSFSLDGSGICTLQYPLGQSVYWVWTGTAKNGVLLATSFRRSVPYTEALWAARTTNAPKARPSVPADCAAHREGAGDAHPHCSPSTCNHKAAGNQMSCRFGDMGPARNTADLWKQVYSQKLKCMW